jgi:hypothetical protein
MCGECENYSSRSPAIALVSDRRPMVGAGRGTRSTTIGCVVMLPLIG